jgi:membrane protease YdiL (CAAX protease family)
LVTGSAGAVAAASVIYVGRLHQRVSVTTVYMAVLAVLTGGGLAAFGPRLVWHSHDIRLAVATSLVAGPAAGWLAGRLDVRISRRLSSGTSPTATRTRAATNVRLRPVGLGSAAAGAGRMRDLASATSWAPVRRNRRLRAGPGLLVAGAVLEECVFRGVLVSAAGYLPAGAGRVAGLVAVVAAFALSHVFVGWSQVVAKLPLSVLCMVLAVTTGTVAGAAITHAVVNWRAGRQDTAAAPPPRARLVR